MQAFRARGYAERQEQDRPQRRAVYDAEVDQLVAVYDYIDADGTHIATKGRFERRDETGVHKTFRWKLPTATTWGTLGFGLEEVPLFGASLLRERPDEIVFFVEGEKAALACREHGLLAVCAPTGAQRAPKISRALQVLRNRKVALWPDNDDIGRVYMRAVRALLNGIAQDVYWISVPLPNKGDAYDFFAMGGRVEDIFATLERPSENIIAPDAIEVNYPMEGVIVHVLAEHITPGIHELETDLTISLGTKSFTQRINLLSSSSRQTFARELKQYFGEYNWNTLLIDTTTFATNHVRRSVPIIDITETNPVERQEFLIENFIPLGESSLIFGMGNSGKTYVALYIAVLAAIGGQWIDGQWLSQFPVLWIDYETQRDGRTVRYRTDRICAGIGVSLPQHTFFYLGGTTPVAEQAEMIRNFIRSEGIGLVVIDSAIKAVGGDARSETAVAQYFSALGSFGVTTLTIAHVTKDENPDIPFGSIFWHNEPHGYIWHTSGIESPDPSRSIIALNNKKANDGRKPKSFAIDIHFSDPNGPVVYDLAEIHEQQIEKQAISTATRIMRHLQEHEEDTLEGIHVVVGGSMEEIRRILNINKRFISDNGGKTWRLR